MGPLCVKSFGVTEQGESSNLITDYFVAKIHSSGSATIFVLFFSFVCLFVFCFLLLFFRVFFSSSSSSSFS